MIEDAKRRLEKKQKNQLDSSRVDPAKDVQLTKNSQKLVFKRFEEDFKTVSDHQGLEGNAVLNYQSTSEFVRNLGFIGTSQSFNPLIEELWKFIKNPEEN